MTLPSQPDGYLATPPAGSGPGVLVLHAWWGLNAAIEAFCDALAAEGFVAFAPDLYDGEVATTIEGAEALGQALDARHEEARAEVTHAADFLIGRASGDCIAVIGFSLGAYYALDLAARVPRCIDAVVLYYGSGGGDWSTARARYLGHFAGNDPYEPPSNVDHLERSLRESGREVTFQRYPGVGHWFCEPDRDDAFDASSAALAWTRTLAFLRRA